MPSRLFAVCRSTSQVRHDIYDVGCLRRLTLDNILVVVAAFTSLVVNRCDTSSSRTARLFDGQLPNAARFDVELEGLIASETSFG